MKITKRQLRRIIKEEKAKILREAKNWDDYDEYGNPKDGPKLYGPDAAAAGIADAVKQMTSKRSKKGPDLKLRNAIMDTYETAYDNAMKQREDEEFAQDVATDAVMSEVEAWLDAVGISRTYVGLS
jgi:hypothetical protein